MSPASQLLKRPKTAARAVRIAHRLNLIRLYGRRLVAEVTAHIAQHIGHLLIIQAHRRHRDGGDLLEVLAIHFDRAGEAVHDDPAERRGITGDPIAAGERGIDAGQTEARGLVAVQAERIIDRLAGMLSHGRGVGDFLDEGKV